MLHEALKLIRVFHNMKQGTLAERLGVSQSYLSEVEAGTKQATLELLDKYSGEFKIPVSSILYFAEKKGQKSPAVADAIASKALQMLSWFDTITTDRPKPRHT